MTAHDSKKYETIIVISFVRELLESDYSKNSFACPRALLYFLYKGIQEHI